MNPFWLLASYIPPLFGGISRGAAPCLVSVLNQTLRGSIRSYLCKYPRTSKGRGPFSPSLSSPFCAKQAM